MKKLLIIISIIALAIIAAVYTVPATLVKLAEKTLSENLKTEVKVESADLSFLNGSINVNNVTVKDYPQFSKGNLFELNKLVFKIEPMSVFSKVIVINELTIDGVALGLNGGITENSLKTLMANLESNKQADIKEEKMHHDMAEKEGIAHDHGEHELRLKIKSLNINNLKLNAAITHPFKLAEKSVKIKGINAKNLGGEHGVNVNNITQEVVGSIDTVITEKISKMIPAQRAYENIEDGIEKGSKKAKTLFNKYFK